MKHVLIVDDEIRLLQSIAAGLKNYQEAFTVTTALNGQEAVDILSEKPIDLVVTDLRMPEMDGFELLAHLSATHPFLPFIVMTAFATPEIEERLNSAGTSKLLEKPIDFERLAEAIIEGLEQEGKEGSVAGFSLANFLQLLAMEQKTSLLNVQSQDIDGYIYLDQGEINAAIMGTLKGEEAIYQMLAHESVQITFKKVPTKKVKKTIDRPLMSLLVEGMRRKDEKILKADTKSGSQPDESDVAENSAAKQSPAVYPPNDAQPNQEGNGAGKSPEVMNQLIQGELTMGQLEDSLSKLSDIDGFMAAGIFTPNGEMAAQVNNTNLKIAEIGSLANDVLLKAQKATDVMDIGRGQVVHIEAPKAHIIARCLNEAQEFAATSTGKAHLHMIMLLNKDGNLAMGKIKLESVIHEVSAAFR